MSSPATAPTTARRARRVIDRQPTGDDADPVFASGEETTTTNSPRRAPTRRGVQRKPTGDMELELMMSIDAGTDDEGEEGMPTSEASVETK